MPIDNLAGRISAARLKGFSDDDIASMLAEGDQTLAPKIQAAKQGGFASKDIVDMLGKSALPTKQQVQQKTAQYAKASQNQTPPADWSGAWDEIKQQGKNLVGGLIAPITDAATLPMRSLQVLRGKEQPEFDPHTLEPRPGTPTYAARQASKEQWEKGKEALAGGSPATAIGRFAASTPYVGPAVGATADLVAQKKYGRAAVQLATMFAPELGRGTFRAAKALDVIPEGAGASVAAKAIEKIRSKKAAAPATIAAPPEAIATAPATEAATPATVTPPAPAPEPISSNHLVYQKSERGLDMLEKHGPALEKYGLTGAKDEVTARAKANIKRIGPKIGEAVEKVDAAGVVPEPQTILDKIAELKSNNQRLGVPLNDAYERALNKGVKKLEEMATTPEGEMKFSDVNDLKREWQDEADASHSYNNEDARGSGLAHRDMAAVTRDVLRSLDGEEGVAALNNLEDEFTANKAAKKLAASAAPPKPPPPPKVPKPPKEVKPPGPPPLTPMQRGLTKLGAMAAGGVAGHLLGGHEAVGVLTGAYVTDMLRDAVRSGSIKRAPQAMRNALADSLARGDARESARYTRLMMELDAKKQSQ